MLNLSVFFVVQTVLETYAQGDKTALLADIVAQTGKQANTGPAQTCNEE